MRTKRGVRAAAPPGIPEGCGAWPGASRVAASRPLYLSDFPRFAGREMVLFSTKFLQDIEQACALLAVKQPSFRLAPHGTGSNRAHGQESMSWVLRRTSLIRSQFAIKFQSATEFSG